jgi:hypothetical protein
MQDVDPGENHEGKVDNNPRLGLLAVCLACQSPSSKS